MKDAFFRVLTVSSGRNARWVVFVVWILIAGGIGSLAGKLDSVQKNDSSSFLPGSAESSKVLQDIKRYPNGQTASAVVLYYRPGGLTPRDLAQINAARVRLNRNLPPFALAAPRVVVSKNRTTALLVPEVKFTGKSDIFKAAVKGINNATTFAARAHVPRQAAPARRPRRRAGNRRDRRPAARGAHAGRRPGGRLRL